MVVYELAAVITPPSDEDFLVVRQAPPPPLPEDEYQSYVDSDLWDLPSAPLNLLEVDCRSELVIEGAGSVSSELDLGKFDVDSAVDQVLSQVCKLNTVGQRWSLWKYVEEAEFGPGPHLNTVIIRGRVETKEEILQESCQWLSKERALQLLRIAKPNAARVGPLVFTGLFPYSIKATKFKAPPALHYQEYPPGIILVPMKRRTGERFPTTNLVVVVPDDTIDTPEDAGFVAYGDALLVDPGSCSQVHGELAELVAALPKKLVVFVTHHHYDHIDGLSVIQKCNPDAILLAHQNTINRFGKGEWSLGHILISGGEKICIGGQQFEAVFAPGHTDGHLGLLHVSTNSLIVGDHCVGEGSAVLDPTAGGNMKEYFNTTYRFLELSPHVLIPMHGRINLWPKRTLCGYLKHRRDRENSILKAIECGAVNLPDIIAMSYPNLDVKLWFLASANVRVHVDHLAYQEKLPKDFSMEEFNRNYVKFRAKMGANDRK